MRRTAAATLALASLLALGSCVFGRGGAINVSALFADIGDLPRFANVQSADVKVGTVRSIKLVGYTARVSMRLSGEAEIPSNVQALIRSTSLLGEKFVDLRVPEGATPSSVPLRDGDVIPLERTERIPGLDDALVKLGRLLEGGTPADLATLVHSTAEIVRGREEALGEIFTRLRTFSGVLADRAPDIAASINNLDASFSSLAASRDVIGRSLSSSADATQILADQQADLDRLVGALDRTSSVLAGYMKATRPSSDRALKDLRLILDQVMTTTGDLSKAVSALATFTDLWPKAIPGDYVQLDVVLTLGNSAPSDASAATAAFESAELTRLRKLAEMLLGPSR
jgi:phospholipid/cholesterol/gamma-HCH transport system substrate-binding protein